MAEQQRRKAYILQSRDFLKNTFVDVSDGVIEHIFNKRSNLNFTDAYHYLAAINSDPGHILEDAPNLRVLRRHPRRKVELSTDNDDLIDEISLIPELIQKPASRPNEVIEISDSEEEEEENRKPAASSFNVIDSHTEIDVEKDDSVECNVCYADYEACEVYHCGFGEEHAVCKTCIGRFVSEQLHGNGSCRFKCIGDVDCESEYPLCLLEKVLPKDLNRQVIERAFHDIAQIDGMWQCPKGCGYVGFIEQQLPWVECPNCNKQYCTSCNEPMHHNRKCEELRLEKERLKDPKHKAHEAMSRACKRFCPHCQQEYIKSDGCNKIKCSKCKLLSCYLCEDKIEDYSHFCNHARNGNALCHCGKLCSLWTSTEAMEKIDRAKRQEAGRKVLLESGYSDGKAIDDILKSPPAKGIAEKDAKVQQGHIVPQQRNDGFRVRQNHEPLRFANGHRPHINRETPPNFRVGNDHSPNVNRPVARPDVPAAADRPNEPEPDEPDAAEMNVPLFWGEVHPRRLLGNHPLAYAQPDVPAAADQPNEPEPDEPDAAETNARYFGVKPILKDCLVIILWHMLCQMCLLLWSNQTSLVDKMK